MPHFPALSESLSVRNPVFPVAIVLFLVWFAAGGCAKKDPPKLVGKAEGVVTVNGAALPAAQVTFIPLTPGLDGSYLAKAVTDSAGRYTLVFPDGRAGAVVGENLVTVSEGPMPEEFRGQDGDSQMGAGNYLRNLANRPIPEAYTVPSLSPLKATVVEGQESYNFDLTR